MKSTNVGAIITCFFPRPHELLALVKSLNNQVQIIFLVDNGGLDKDVLIGATQTRVEILEPKENRGTAGGYNLGAQAAWKNNCSHILLLDQDSECATDMVATLLSLESFLLQQNKKVAVIGPYYISRNTNQPAPFIQHQGLRISRLYENQNSVLHTPSGSKYVECSYVISSGSLISLKAWNVVGDTSEELFLDFTDIEWGLRAQSKGFTCFGSFGAKMYHLIGDEQARFMGRMISLHSPLRHYYAFRNCVWLFSQDYIPFGTRFNYLMKLAPKLLVYAWFSSQPGAQIRSMLRGIADGLRGRMGVFQK